MMTRYRLRERRLALGLTQAELGAKIGLAQGQVSAAEIGRRPDANCQIILRVRSALFALERERRDRGIEQRAIAAGRASAARMPSSPQWDELKALMRRRANFLLEHARVEEADIVLEFLPEDEVAAVLDEAFPDFAPHAEQPEIEK